MADLYLLADIPSIGLSDLSVVLPSLDIRRAEEKEAVRWRRQEKLEKRAKRAKKIDKSEETPGGKAKRITEAEAKEKDYILKKIVTDSYSSFDVDFLAFKKD